MRNIHRHGTDIWQQPDWPDFKWDSDALLEPIQRVSRLHGLLSGRMSMLGFNDKAGSMLSAMADELISSSEIEGMTLNRDSVRSSIARRLGIENNGIPAEDHYVEGLVDVMLDATTNCNEPLSDERLFGWHAALFPLGRSGMYKITVAYWRRGEEPMVVVSGALGHEKIHFQAPPSAAVPAEMERFINRCNTSEHSPLIMAAVAHLQFVTIHPFDDGNGRLGRTLADMFLARLDGGDGRYYSMSAEINRNKKAYYDVLEQTQKGGLDITAWLLWFTGCLESAISRALEGIDGVLRKTAYWDRFRDTDINERQRKIINRLFDGLEGKLTTSKWAKMCKCSRDTALRDINDLLAKGMLRDSGEGGRSTNYLLP